MKSSFWKNKRVLITGHTGFKGGWLTLWLHSLGAKVAGYALAPSTEPCLYNVAKVSEVLDGELIGDISEENRVREFIDQTKPEIVFHMAAQALVRYSYSNPIETYRTNVMGTVNLLEAVRLNGAVKVLVNITSDKCYENREWVWGYRENEAMGGHDPYSSSKGCAELATSAYRSSYFSPDKFDDHGVALASVRAGNVIGGGDWAEDRLVPDAMRSFSEHKSVVIRNPLAVRPWQHVLDPLHGYMMLAEKLWDEPALAQAWNFGPLEEDTRSVQWVIEALCRHWDGVSWEHDSSIQPHEAKLLTLDCSKARYYLGWRPSWELEHSLGKVVSWYQAFYRSENMKQYSLEQIKEFESASVAKGE